MMASMEQRLSYTLGFDIANPAQGRVPAGLGGSFFSINQDTPANLRGLADGFLATALIRPRLAPGLNKATANQFLCGSFDFGALEGWAMLIDYTVGVLPELVVLIGAASFAYTLTPLSDNVVTLAGDPSGSGVLVVNGAVVDSGAAVAAAFVGPDNFGIGGTVDPSYVVSAGTDAFGALSTQIGGVAVYGAGDLLPLNPATTATSFVIEQYNAIKQALDVVQTPASPIPETPPTSEMPQASHIFSTRRGLSQIADNDNRTWVDEVSSTVLTRQGVQLGATVEAHEPNWLTDNQL